MKDFALFRGWVGCGRMLSAFKSDQSTPERVTNKQLSDYVPDLTTRGSGSSERLAFQAMQYVLSRETSSDVQMMQAIKGAGRLLTIPEHLALYALKLAAKEGLTPSETVDETLKKMVFDQEQAEADRRNDGLVEEVASHVTTMIATCPSTFVS